MKREGGFTMLEVLMASTIGVVVIGGAFFMLQQMVESHFAMERRLGTFNEIAGLRFKLGRDVGGGQLRSFLFTGRGTPQPGDVCGTCSPTGADRSLGRFVMPLANKCRDLGDCDGGMTLLFASLSKRRANGLEALCLVDSQHVLVMSNAPVGALVSLLGPPTSTIWRTQGAPQPLAVDPGTGAPLNSDCIETLQRSNGGTLPPGPFYSLEIKPVMAAPFTGGTCVCASEIERAINFFPAPIVEVDVFALGTLGSGPATTFGMNRCSISEEGTAFTCTENTDFLVNGVSHVEMHEEFEYNDASRPAITWFALTSGTTAPDPLLCPVDSCAAMQVPPQVRSALVGESFDAIDFRTFSLIKQEILRRVRFQIRRTDGRTYGAEVQF